MNEAEKSQIYMKYKFKSKLTTFITCLASLSDSFAGKATQQNILGEN